MRFAVIGCLLWIQLWAIDTNALIDEESPYLQQHAHQPIAWLPWSDESFEKAKREHKPIFLSIGYSTCHWCHVMSRESFDDETVAAILNRYYICIKVDREEMPHIDSYYQKVYETVHHRSGGWPLTVMMDANREVFFITTYIPNVPKYGVEGIKTTLKKFANLYVKHPEMIARRTKAIAALQSKAPSESSRDVTVDATTFFNALTKEYDAIYKGFSIAPKFPEASKIELLFVLGDLGYLQARQMALDVLRTMALRGIYDQIDGGFFRYCVDADWEIPHFEKMLYNQAELIPLYVKAYQITQDKLYADIVEETIAMVYERFENNALFYSASNADVGEKEGAYFIYSVEQIDTALQASNVKGSLAKAMEFRRRGNFGTKIHVGFYTQQRPQGFKPFRAALKKLRRTREYPFVDTKIITSWNAMMIEALFDAAVIHERYGILAEISLANFTKLLEHKGILYHQSLNGNFPYAVALLEDYAATIHLYIKAYQYRYRRSYLTHAQRLMQEALQQFYTQGRWYLNHSKPKVTVDLRDKYYTSAIGTILQSMQQLAALSGSPTLQRHADVSLALLKHDIVSHSTAAPSSVIALLMQRYGVVALKHRRELLLQYQTLLSDIRYPFLVSNASEQKEFLACKVDRCFAYSSDFLHVKQRIEESLLIQ